MRKNTTPIGPAGGLARSGVRFGLVGFGWRRDGDIWQTDVAIDVVVKDKDGKALQRAQDFTNLRVGSRIRNREMMAQLTYSFTDIPAGEYIVESIMRDKVSGKTGSFSLPFIVRSSP